jgi:membrane-bound lytic murein transglycosylase F
MAALIMLPVCATPDAPTVPRAPEPDPVPHVADRVFVPVAQEVAVVREDLPAMRKAGVLRVLTHRRPASSLGRTGSPLDRELALVEIFARSQSIPVRFVNVEGRAQLLSALAEGRGDMIASQLTVTEAREKQVQFGAPIRYVQELVVVPRAVPDAPTTLPALAGRDMWLRPSSSFAEHLAGLSLEPPPVLHTIEETVDPHTVLYRVGSGEYGMTVADSDVLESYTSYRDDVKLAVTLREEVPIAWATRPSAAELRVAIDDFVRGNVEVYRGPAVFEGDLDAIQKRGILRIAMPNNSLSYFFFRGAPFGHQYSLGLRLAKELGVRLEVVVARRQRDLLPLLLSGRADLVAGTLTDTDQRRDTVDFSVPLARVDELLVQPSGEPLIKSVDQLAGRQVHVRRTSSYWETLSRLQASVPTLELVAADSEMETEQLIDLVGAGRVPLTVADYDIFHIGLGGRSDVQSGLVVGHGRERGYAMRKGSPQLKEAVDAFVVSVRGRPRDDPRHRERSVEVDVPPGQLSPYDALAKKYGAQFKVDWKLLVAVMQVESGYWPEHRSLLGARGLMGVMPHTLAALGLAGRDLTDPEVSIHAGAARLSSILLRLADLEPAERRRMAVAAYHVGIEHVLDARSLAARLDLDSRIWADNVEQAMLLKRTPDYAGETRFGYCLGAAARDYVLAVDAVLAGF